MELTEYFHRIYSIVPWNPLNFHGINGKNLWHFMNFHNFLLLVYLPSTAMETLKTPSEYSVDFNRGFQRFSMANLEKEYWAGRVYDFCVYFLTGAPEGSTKSGFMGNICLWPCSLAVPVLAGWVYAFCGSLSRNSRRLNRQWFWF